MNSDKKQPVTVESLLRLKRAEQPPSEFWTQFNNDLRAKQLAAIVAKRPWWHGASRVGILFSRHPWAFGTTAALTVALFTVTEYRGNERFSPAASSTDGVSYVSAPVAARIQPEAVTVVRASLSVSAHPAVPPARVGSAKASDDTFGGELESMISAPMPGHSLASVAPHDETMQIERSDRGMAALGRSLTSINLAAIQAAGPEVMRDPPAFAQNFQSPVPSENGQVIDPLSQMTSPSDENRSRLVGEAVPQTASFESAPASQSDHFVNRLPDDRVYESISRYAQDSDRLSIKF